MHCTVWAGNTEGICKQCDNRKKMINIIRVNDVKWSYKSYLKPE